MSEGAELADERGGNVGIARVGEDQDGLNVGTHAVGGGDIALVLKILDAPDASENILCALALSEIHGEVGVSDDTNPRLTAIKFFNLPYALAHGISTLLMNIRPDGDDNLIEQRQRALDDVCMADGEGIEGTREKSYPHILKVGDNDGFQ